MTSLALLRRSATLLLLSASPALAQPLPSASDVIARYVTAIGGRDAILKIQSVQQKGTMSMPSAGMSGEMEAVYVLPNKNATRVTIGGFGDVLGGTDGTVAWSINPMQGPRLLTDKEAESAKDLADFQGQTLLSADRFSSIEVQGVEDFAGEKTYKVRFVSKVTGDPAVRYFSTTSGLLVGSELTTTTAMGVLETRMVYSDYKEFGGVKFPTRTESSFGPQSMQMTITEITLNAAPPGAVTVPDAIKPMIKK